MIFNKGSFNDIKKYYYHNWIKVKEAGDRIWKVVEITPNEVVLMDIDGFTLYMDLAYDYEVDFTLPGRVVYQSGASCCILYRIPARQYNRGISPENTALARLTGGGSWEKQSLTQEVLQQYADKPVYLDINAVDMTHYGSIAMSPVFSVTKTGHLFALQTKVGDVIFNKKEVHVSPLLKSEITPYFKDWTIV